MAEGDKLVKLDGLKAAYDSAIGDLDSVAYIARNRAYVTDGVNDAHYGLSYAKGSGKNVLTVYGTATGNAFFNVFNGANGYTNSGSALATKNIAQGTYTVYFTKPSSMSDSSKPFSFTASTYSDRQALENGGTLEVPEDGGCIFIRLTSGAVLGTEEAPGAFTLIILEGANQPLTPTAIDRTARAGIESANTAISGKLATAQGIENAGKIMTVNAEGNAAPAAPSAITEIAGKLDKAQGVENANKLLKVGSDGDVDLLTVDALKAQMNPVSLYDHGPYDLYAGRLSDWYSGLQTQATYTALKLSATYADVITLFDALVTAAPDYVSKSADPLGYSTLPDPNENNETAYPLWEYVFAPRAYSGSTSAAIPKKRPKVYLDGSIHGFEKCSTFGLYFFLKDLVENWEQNPSLAYIRQNVEIHVIPVVNPWGFNQYSSVTGGMTGVYKNARGVNINRNFDHPGEWTPVRSGSDQNNPDDESITGPFTENESQIIRDWLTAAVSAGGLLFYANLHTNGNVNSQTLPEMNSCMTSNDRNDAYFNRIFRVFRNHIEEQTLRWPEMYSAIQPGEPLQGNFCGKILASATSEGTAGGRKGTASCWANTMNHILGMTFEGFNGLVDGTEPDGVTIIKRPTTSDDTGYAVKINSENIGNLVIQMLREYAE